MVRTKIALALVAAAVAAGCAAPSHIATNKSQAYTAEPKRVFVVDAMGPDMGRDFSDGFDGRLQALMRGCGAESRVTRVSTLELDERKRIDSMRQFGPDSLMRITRTGGTKDQYGNLINAVYDVQLMDMKSNATVWRANVRFARGITFDMKERGGAMATEIVDKMKADGLFRSC